MGHAIGWDEKMDLEKDLYSLYSVYRKPAADN
jgi:hypothetical protein